MSPSPPAMAQAVVGGGGAATQYKKESGTARLLGAGNSRNPLQTDRTGVLTTVQDLLVLPSL